MIELRDKIKTAIKDTNEAKRIYFDTAQKTFTSLLNEVAKTANDIGLYIAVVQGSTPSFNDGDLCTHSSEVLLDENDFSDYGYDPDEDTQVNELSEDDEKMIIDLLLSYDDYYLQPKYNTNYQVVIRFKDGEANITYEEYDCGY